MPRFVRSLGALTLFATSIGLGAVAPAAAAPAEAPAVRSTAGTDFWVTFNANLDTPTYSLSLSGASATSGTITWADDTTTGFTVSPGSVTTVPLPTGLTSRYHTQTDDGIVDGGIHITAENPVTVYGLNYGGGSSDAYTALPTPTLTDRYRALAAEGTIGPDSRIQVLAPEDGVVVTVTPAAPLGARAAGTPYDINLDRGEVYTVTGSDVTGTLITATEPVAVWASNDCVNVGAGACDTIVEQMVPTSQWGTSFIGIRFAKESGGSSTRILADRDGTAVRIDGAPVATLQAGEFYEATLMDTTGNVGTLIESDKPVLVLQFMEYGTYVQGEESTSGDPAAMLVPPYQQFLDSYTFATPGSSFLFNAVNVAIPTSATASLRLDGAAVEPAAFAPLAGTEFSTAQLLVSAGTHTLSADRPFGAFAYGANNFNSYAYPGGNASSPVGSVATVEVLNDGERVEQGEEACLTIKVEDADGAAVTGVRVDLSVASGPNAGAAGDAVTGADGTAEICYTGASIGEDTLSVSSGTASASATVVVTEPITVSAPTGLTAAPGVGRAQLTWTAPTETGGATITGYRIESSAESGAWTVLVTDTGSAATSRTVTGLGHGGKYSFRVAAITASGTGATSAPASATLPTAPGAPQITAITSGNHLLYVAFSAPPSDGGDDIVRYQYSVDDGATWHDRRTGSAQSPLVIGGLDNGTTYTVKLRAVNGVGTGAASATVQGQPRVAPMPKEGPGSDVPAPGPGKALLLVDGAPQQVTVTSTAETVTITGDGFTMSLEGRDPEGHVLETDDSGRLILTSGGLLTVQGAGFAPGSVVDVWLFSTPQLLGPVTVGADGSFRASLPVPADIEAGPHTAQLNGVLSDGTTASVSLGLVVIGTAAAPALAATGVDPSTPLLVVVGLLGAGGVLLVASRRVGRRRSQQL